MSINGDFAGKRVFRFLPRRPLVSIEIVTFFTGNSDFTLLKFTLGAEETLAVLRKEDEA